jgi:hypothetical protein
MSRGPVTKRSSILSTWNIILVLFIVYIAVAAFLLWPDKNAIAIIILSIITAAIAMIALFKDVLSNDKEIKEKQLEKLYMPLKMGLENLNELDIREIERYSYLATGKLAVCIDSFIIQRRKYPNRTNADNPTDKEVLDAIDSDIGQIKEGLKGYLEI